MTKIIIEEIKDKDGKMKLAMDFGKEEVSTYIIIGMLLSTLKYLNDYMLRKPNEKINTKESS